MFKGIAREDFLAGSRQRTLQKRQPAALSLHTRGGAPRKVDSAALRDGTEAAFFLRRVAERDEGAFERLAERYGLEAFQLARQICASPDHAEEVVQEAFLQIWRKAGAFQPPGNPRSWILTIVARRALKYRRSVGSRSRHEHRAAAGKRQLEPTLHPGPEELLAGLVDLRAEWAKMPPKNRELIFLYFKAGLTQQEIGRLLAQSQRTVGRGLDSALQALSLRMARP